MLIDSNIEYVPEIREFAELRSSSSRGEVIHPIGPIDCGHVKSRNMSGSVFQIHSSTAVG